MLRAAGQGPPAALRQHTDASCAPMPSAWVQGLERVHVADHAPEMGVGLKGLGRLQPSLHRQLQTDHPERPLLTGQLLAQAGKRLHTGGIDVVDGLGKQQHALGTQLRMGVGPLIGMALMRANQAPALKSSVSASG